MRLPHIFQFIITAVLLSISTLSMAKTPKDPLLGTWKVIDSRTGGEQGAVDIRYNPKTKMYYGVSVRSTRGLLDKPCKKCTGKLKGKTPRQIPTLWNFKKGKKPNTYTGGYIIEYTTGKIFSATMKVSKSGRRLQLRGSPLGAKFIGRTVYWIRDK